MRKTRRAAALSPLDSIVDPDGEARKPARLGSTEQRAPSHAAALMVPTRLVDVHVFGLLFDQLSETDGRRHFLPIIPSVYTVVDFLIYPGFKISEQLS